MINRNIYYQLCNENWSLNGEKIMGSFHEK